MNNQPPQRVSAISSPDDYQLPSRLESASAPTQDAYRQTQFLLGPDLKAFAEAQRLQIALIKDAYPSRFRTHALGSIVALWSRAYQYMADALLLACHGSYASTIPLVRTTCEVLAAQEALRAGDQPAYDLWLSNTLKPDEQFKAFEFELGRFFAGEVLATDSILRVIYRSASELGRPNFGASLLQVAPESNNLRLALSFADNSFHLGWAEMIVGWQLALALRQLRLILDADSVFPVSEERRQSISEVEATIQSALSRDDRCVIQETETPGGRRYLISNFRRAASAAPKKVIL